jgi:hypothetical protein
LPRAIKENAGWGKIEFFILWVDELATSLEGQAAPMHAEPLRPAAYER